MQCYSEHLQIDLKEILITSLVLHLGKSWTASWPFSVHKKHYLSYLPNQICFSVINMELNILWGKMTQKCQHYVQHFWLFPLVFIDELWKTKKIRILKKTKIAGDIIILQLCTKNHNHKEQFLIYQVKQNFLSFWVFFPCPIPLPHLTAQKSKILKQWKEHLQMSSF